MSPRFRLPAGRVEDGSRGQKRPPPPTSLSHSVAEEDQETACSCVLTLALTRTQTSRDMGHIIKASRVQNVNIPMQLCSNEERAPRSVLVSCVTSYFFLQCILYFLGKEQILDVVVFPPYFLFAQEEEEGVEAVSVGAILSDYQRVRVENV